MRTLTLLLAAAVLASPPLVAPALTIKPGTAWPVTTIPVCWEAPHRAQRRERELIRRAIAATWERESALRFTGWRGCRDGDGGIRIVLETGYPRVRGRGVEIDGVEGGVVLAPLAGLAGASASLQIPVHEFGHALGFGHEYARRDIADPARCGGTDRSGHTYHEDDLALTPYDTGSVMVGCRPEAARQFARGRPELSPIDIFGLVRTYGSHPSNVLDADEPGDLFGASMIAADFDGDGLVDLAVGAPGEDDGIGAVYLYRGTARRGLRPWRRVGALDAEARAELGRLGAAGRAAPPDAAAPAVLPARAEAGDEAAAVAHTLAAAWIAGQRRVPALVPVPDVAVPDLINALAGGIGGHPFPDLAGAGGADLVHLAADLDGDGTVDHILGAPHADGGAPGSGAVILFRGLPEGGAEPWYWFGQAY